MSKLRNDVACLNRAVANLQHVMRKQQDEINALRERLSGLGTLCLPVYDEDGNEVREGKDPYYAQYHITKRRDISLPEFKRLIEETLDVEFAVVETQDRIAAYDTSD